MGLSVDFLKICGVAIVCTLLLTVLKKSSGGMDSIVRAGGGIVIFSLLLSGIGEALGSVRSTVLSVADGSGYLGGAFSLMLKALGIALVSKLCADICRDCGENGLAGGIESAGRVAIISLCVPIVSELVGLAVKILEIGE